MLTFDEATHTYRLDGVVVPSVTTIMKPLYNFDFVSELTLEIASKRGVEVHKACEMYDLDDLDESSLDGWKWINYFKAWKRFREESGYVPHLTEKQVHHPTLKFAGTLDSAGVMNGEEVVIDRKTTASLSSAIGVQLAAYDEALRQEDPKQPKRKRYAVQLRPDGTYRLQPYEKSTDWTTFVALINLKRSGHADHLWK